MDAEGRATQEQLPRDLKYIRPYHLQTQDPYASVGMRLKQCHLDWSDSKMDDCMDAEARATQEQLPRDLMFEQFFRAFLVNP